MRDVFESVWMGVVTLMHRLIKASAPRIDILSQDEPTGVVLYQMESVITTA